MVQTIYLTLIVSCFLNGLTWAEEATSNSGKNSEKSWFETGLYPGSLKPKLFQLPYEKITNPLSSFISWITRNDRNVRTYDKLYPSKLSDQIGHIGLGSSSPLTGSSSNLNPVAVSPVSGAPSTSPLATGSAISSINVPVPGRSLIKNQRRQDLLSSFSFARSLTSSLGLPGLTYNSPEATTTTGGQRSNFFKSKDIASYPQFQVSFPRSTPPNQRQLSPLILNLIAKYNPQPKLYFVPKYYPSPYQVPVPFVTHDSFVMTPNSAIGTGGGLSGQNGVYHHYNHRQHGTPVKSSYSSNHLTSASGSIGKSPVIQRIPSFKVNPILPNRAQQVPLSSPPSSSSSWKNDDGDRRRPVPYTGKAQYSTIDNSADPISPSASHLIPFW